METDTKLADAWGNPSVIDFFTNRRKKTCDVYPSERIFLNEKLVEGISVLDIGCAQGGFSNILAENLVNYHYTGLDINEGMIAKAKKNYPEHQFYVVSENNFSCLDSNSYDLVLCLGILHLHEDWKNTIRNAWQHTSGSLIMDLRESYHPTVEDKTESYFKMDFGVCHGCESIDTIPYNIINVSDALKTVLEICAAASKISHFGYMHKVSSSAVTPYKEVMANVYCIDRA